MNRRDSLKATGFLVGSTLLPTFLSGFFQQCTNIKEGIAWTPVFFDDADSQFVIEVIDAILPRTETPSASDALVHVFLDLYAKDCLSTVDQEQFRKGLAELKEAAESGSVEEALSNMEKDESKAAFFGTLKRITLLGYFTSEQGSQKAANLVPVPGGFEGCVPLGEMKVSAL